MNEGKDGRRARNVSRVRPVRKGDGRLGVHQPRMLVALGQARVRTSEEASWTEAAVAANISQLAFSFVATYNRQGASSLIDRKILRVL